MKGDSTILKGSAESEGTDVLSDGIDDEGKENRQSQTKIGDEVVPSPEIKPTLRKRKKASIQESPTVILRRVRHPRTKRVSGAKVEDKTPLWEKPGKLPFASPDFKLPQPTLGHSTPGDMGPSEFPQRDSLFGFDALESPLVLSPVPSMSYMADLDASHASTRQRDSLEKVKNSSSARRFLGTYDIPIRKQTQRNKRKNTKQKNKRVS